MRARRLVLCASAFAALAVVHGTCGHAAQVTISPHRGLLVDGKPFLPISVWLQPVANFDMLTALGINTFMAEGAGSESTREFLDAAQQRGAWGIIHAREEHWPLKDHPALLTWMFGDEPDLPATIPYKSAWSGPRGPDASVNIWWEAEAPAAGNISGEGWPNTESPVLSGGRWLGLNASSLPPEGHFHAQYRIEVPQAGAFILWSREFGKANASPTWWRFDEGAWEHTPRDLRMLESKRVASNLSVGWHRYGAVQLGAGSHVFEIKVNEGRTLGRSLEAKEDDYLVAFDAFLLTTSNQEPLTPDPPARPRVTPEQIAEQFAALKAADRNHPACLNLTSGFHEQFKRYDDATYEAYCRAADIASYDMYPVTGWGRPEWVPLIGPVTAKLHELGGDAMPVWAILECTTKLRWVSQERLDQIGHPRGAHADELRAMVWLAIVNGATSIGYFPHRWDPYKQADISEELQEEMKRTNRQLTELAPAILDADAAPPIAHEDLGGGPVQTLTKQHAGARYLFAVNTTREPARARFRIPQGARVEAYEEQRTIQVGPDGFEESFEPLAVHIYIIRQP